MQPQVSTPLDLTLVIVQSGERVLLGLKKRGFGAGNWNGFGGKVEPNEMIVAAAQRELQEEAGLTARNCLQHGILHASFATDADMSGLSLASPLIEKELLIHVFRVTSFTGTPSETTEMQPAWFSVAAIPYDQMWEDDRHWLPALLAGKFFSFTATFASDHRLLSHQFKELSATSFNRLRQEKH